MESCASFESGSGSEVQFDEQIIVNWNNCFWKTMEFGLLGC